MLTLDRAAFEQVADEFDRDVSRAPEVDHFCSSSAWTLAAHGALHGPSGPELRRELWCRRGEHGWALLARSFSAPNPMPMLQPLEAAWWLASPLICTGDPWGLAREVAGELAESAPDDVVVLSGLAAGSVLLAAIVDALRGRYRLRATVVPPTRRFLASLDGGVAGFLARRSSSFRAGMRQAERKGARAGLSFEAVTVRTEEDARALHARLLALEARSWKGREGVGLAVGEMAQFYGEMLPTLARKGALRVQAGRLAGEDVAIIVGAVGATPDGVVYRGLQFSFDDAHRPLSLGNLAQLAQIAALSAEGVAAYDLGSEVEYKARWGERVFETLTLVAVPRPGLVGARGTS